MTPVPTARADSLYPELAARIRSGGTHGDRPVSPFTGEPTAPIPLSTVEDVHLAVRRARAVQAGWAAARPRDRVAVLRRFHALASRRDDTLLDLIQTETGKSRKDALQEALDPVLVAGYYQRTTRRHLRPRRKEGMVPLVTGGVEHRVPKGVVGVIVPWNYPYALALADTIPALLAGNAVVLKPDPATALSSIYGVRLLDAAGLPPGVLQVVCGDGSVGRAVVDACDYVAFTGSTASGRDVATRAADRLVGCSLELGGKNPMLVLADADVRRAATAAVAACFTNSGQVCLATERVYADERVYDAFLGEFVTRARALRQAMTRDFEADIGSLTSAGQLRTVSECVEDARSKGATVLCGGRARPDIGRFCYEPTILTGVTPDMRCAREETFGPVVAVYRVDGDAEAVERANDTGYGLNACVFGGSRRRARAVARRIRAGSVIINEGFASGYGSKDASMGGVGSSGLGRRNGAEGLLRFTEAQAVVTQRVALLPPPAWLPYRWFAPATTAALRAMAAIRLR